jgi:hypothetical protein
VTSTARTRRLSLLIAALAVCCGALADDIRPESEQPAARPFADEKCIEKCDTESDKCMAASEGDPDKLQACDDTYSSCLQACEAG